MSTDMEAKFDPETKTLTITSGETVYTYQLDEAQGIVDVLWNLGLRPQGALQMIGNLEQEVRKSGDAPWLRAQLDKFITAALKEKTNG